MSYEKRKEASVLAPLDKWVEVPELGASVLIEKSKHGEQTRLYWAKKRRIQHRRLTREGEKE